MLPSVDKSGILRIRQHDRRAVGGEQRKKLECGLDIADLREQALRLFRADRPDVGDRAAAQMRKLFPADRRCAGKVVSRIQKRSRKAERHESRSLRWLIRNQSRCFPSIDVSNAGEVEVGEPSVIVLRSHPRRCSFIRRHRGVCPCSRRRIAVPGRTPGSPQVWSAAAKRVRRRPASGDKAAQRLRGKRSEKTGSDYGKRDITKHGCDPSRPGNSFRRWAQHRQTRSDWTIVQRFIRMPF